MSSLFTGAHLKPHDRYTNCVQSVLTLLRATTKHTNERARRAKNREMKQLHLMAAELIASMKIFSPPSFPFGSMQANMFSSAMEPFHVSTGYFVRATPRRILDANDFGGERNEHAFYIHYCHSGVQQAFGIMHKRSAHTARPRRGKDESGRKK